MFHLRTLYVFCLLAIGTTLVTPSTLMANTPDFVKLAEELKPAVVNISTSKKVTSQAPRFRGDPFFEDFF